MTYFEALGEALRDLLEPAAVGATKVTTKGPKNSALADADVTVDVNGAARAIAVDAKQTFELPIDGVKLVAKANHHGDLSADVAASVEQRGEKVKAARRSSAVMQSERHTRCAPPSERQTRGVPHGGGAPGGGTAAGGGHRRRVAPAPSLQETDSWAEAPE